jgi:8-amino-7-oxononanoate synthase
MNAKAEAGRPIAPIWDAGAERLRGEPARRRKGDHWLAAWLESCADLARLQYEHPMVDAVIDEIDGRMIRIGDRWLADFASCNYLGLDLDREVIDAVPEYLRRWGTHPSWSRLLGSPALNEEIESALTDLLDAPDTLLLPTITHIHTAVIPVLAGNGTIYLDGRAHKTIYDATATASGHGATVRRFRHADADHLSDLLREGGSQPRLICMDGVNSMTGNAPDLAAFVELAHEYGALLYVDDAHGFGVVGQRSRDELCDYGTRGNGILRHQGVGHDGVVLVAGMSKAYSSLLAFIACPPQLKRALKTAAPPYLYSGPSPVASLATAIEGLRVNARRGDDLRATVHRLTHRTLGHLDALGIRTPNTSGYPIVEVPLRRPADIDAVGRHLFDRGVYVTLAAYPLVPRDQVGFRVQVTAANTDEQVDHLGVVLAELDERFGLSEARTEQLGGRTVA